MASNIQSGSLERGSLPALDLSKLHSLPSEQQDLYLLSFTAELAAHAESLDVEGVSTHQAHIKKEVLQVITLSSPAPTRVIRKNVGRCLTAIFAKESSKLLFETTNELVGILASGKSERERNSKYTAAHCLGSVFEAAGENAVSLSSLAITTLLRCLKAAQNQTAFRVTVFCALQKIIRGVGGSGDEAISREIWKQARSAVSGDKSFSVQANASRCLEQLVRTTPFFDNANDFERLQVSLWKALDSTSAVVRHAAASCVSAHLVKTLSDSPILETTPTTKKVKRNVRKPQVAEEENEAVERPGSPAPQKPAVQFRLTLAELLRQLSIQYCRPATSNRARAGLAVCYMNFLKEIGSTVVENNYGVIALHLFNDILSAPTITQHRFRQLTARKYVGLILEDVVGRQILGERGQLAAATFLINSIIKDYPQTLKERTEPTKQALTGALSALATLTESLGSAAVTVADACRDGLVQVLQHPSYTVQVYASMCLRSLVLSCPQQLLPSVTTCLNGVRRELSLLGESRLSSRRCVGLANGLAAAVSTSSLQPLYGSLDINARISSEANSLLKASSSSEIRISSTQIQVAWIMIGGLMSLGPNFVKIHLSQFLLLWKNALTKPLSKDDLAQRDPLELSFLLHVRECALGAILSFLKFNSRLSTVDVIKRLATMLQNTTVFLHNLPAAKHSQELSHRLTPALQLYDLEVMVRRRVLQCYTKLVALNANDSNELLLHSNILPFAISSFAAPDNYTPSSLSASIASSSGSFEGIWDLGDNSGFGVTGLVEGFVVMVSHLRRENNPQHHCLYRAGPEADVDRTVSLENQCRHHRSELILNSCFRPSAEL